MEHKKKSGYYDQEFKIEGLDSVEELVRNLDDVFYQKKNDTSRTLIEEMKKSKTINLLSSLKSSNYLDSIKKEGKKSYASNSESPIRDDSPEGTINKRINGSNLVFSRNYYNSNCYYSNYFDNKNNGSPNKNLEKERLDNNNSNNSNRIISKYEYSKIMMDKSDELYNSINVKTFHLY